MWGFPVNFPLNQSIDCFMILRNGIMNGKREWKRVNTKRAASNIGDVHKFPTWIYFSVAFYGAFHPSTVISHQWRRVFLGHRHGVRPNFRCLQLISQWTFHILHILVMDSDGWFHISVISSSWGWFSWKHVNTGNPLNVFNGLENTPFRFLEFPEFPDQKTHRNPMTSPPRGPAYVRSIARDSSDVRWHRRTADRPPSGTNSSWEARRWSHKATGEGWGDWPNFLPPKMVVEGI